MNVFVGGDFTAWAGAAESEGLLVVLGSATVDTGGPYNVGVVGVGSGIAPPARGDHLIVGRSLSVADDSLLIVGTGQVADQWGTVAFGTTTEGPVDLAPPGHQRTDPEAVDRFAGVPGLIDEASRCAASNPDTGDVVAGEAMNTIFRGDGSSEHQVFTVSGHLPVDAGTVQFEDIPAGATVLINVVGASADLNVNSVLNMTVDDGRRLLWNFPDATQIAVRGFAQLPGTVLAPNTAGTTTISVPGVNGRVLINGDLVHSGFNGIGGRELHNYPFLGDVPCAETGDPTPSETAPEPTDAPTPTDTAAPEPTPTDTAPTEAPTPTDTTTPTDTATDEPTQTPTDTGTPTEEATEEAPEATAPATGPVDTTPTGPAPGTSDQAASAAAQDGGLATTGASGTTAWLLGGSLALIAGGALILFTTRGHRGSQR